MSAIENRIVISGAGLAGSLLAIMLARRGFEVTVYEKRLDMRTHDIPAGRSINLALAARGIRALEHAGVMERVRELLIPMPGRMLHPLGGEQHMQPYGSRPTEVNYSVSRADLNRALMNEAEATGKVRILFEHEVQDIDFATRTLKVRNTSTHDEFEDRGLPVLAADGAASPVRHAMARQLGIRHSEDILDHAYKELRIPPTESNGWRIEKNALHIWPRGGFMVIALPNLDGTFTCTLFLARQGEPSFESLQTPEALREFFNAQFPDLVPLLPDLEHDFFHNPLGILGTVRCEPWHHEDQAVLIGDAAHAVVPFHGQGMNAAFEDCIELDLLIEKHGRDWKTIFAEYSKARKPNGDAIAQMALENYVEMRDSVRDPAFHLRKQVEFELERRFPQRFIPRYSMVMFHPEIPYAEALARGERQQQLLRELTEGKTSLQEVDLSSAEAALARHGL
ncbi:MAG TPA: NAD(P)/FAD-dependent oxidoreductase [Gammaproteobacteria bacterium]|nr:NAD(P)/FAD-dependent oxidoreductase [Gammaproteobacteria bacterium]